MFEVEGEGNSHRATEAQRKKEKKRGGKQKNSYLCETLFVSAVKFNFYRKEENTRRSGVATFMRVPVGLRRLNIPGYSLLVTGYWLLF